MMCLDYDGNVLDACIIALLAALKNSMCSLQNRLFWKLLFIRRLTVYLLPTAQLPEVTINTETSSPEVNLEKRRGLHIHKHPVGASFCVFDE